MVIQLFLLVAKNATFDAVGSIIAAIDGVENKQFNNAFCPVRPPGHHADRNKQWVFVFLIMLL